MFHHLSEFTIEKLSLYSAEYRLRAAWQHSEQRRHLQYRKAGEEIGKKIEPLQRQKKYTCSHRPTKEEVILFSLQDSREEIVAGFSSPEPAGKRVFRGERIVGSFNLFITSQWFSSAGETHTQPECTLCTYTFIFALRGVRPREGGRCFILRVWWERKREIDSSFLSRFSVHDILARGF